MSDLIYPILDDAIDFDKKDSATNSSSATVGLVVATLYYRDLIRDILPNSSVGMRVVFSICDVNFTYELAGPNADYVGPADVGPADVHDAEYDNLRIQSSREFAIRNPKYSGVPIDAEYCDYALYLYPSDRMRASHTSHIPIISTAVVLFIFAFSSLVFVIYDIKVENRQLSVMKTAVRSSEIVSSLFPSAVRDRLYPDSITLDKKATGNTETKTDEPTSNVICSPIGELYPNTTVMFADLSGFTVRAQTPLHHASVGQVR
jgi:hypothetical protein